jgi:hypothetical protein
MKVMRFLVIGIWAVWLAACTAPNPIDTSNPVEFQHELRVFTIQAPGAWNRAQDKTGTEAVAVFGDPSGQARLIAYVGLLSHRFTEAEGLDTVSKLVQGINGRPADYQVTTQQRQADGAFDVSFTFTRNDQKLAGRATFRDTDLALSGVIVSAPEANWSDLQAALQPYVDSFQVDSSAVKGTYFVPLDGPNYAMAIPPDWPQQKRSNSIRVTSLGGDMSILAVQQDGLDPLDTAGLTDQATKSLRQLFGVQSTASDRQLLEDGRLKVTLDAGARRIVGFAEQRDGTFYGLFFDVPADRAADYQAFIDFEYFTYVTHFRSP